VQNLQRRPIKYSLGDSLQVWLLVQYMPQNSRRLQEAANFDEICASIARRRPEAENIFGRQAHGPRLHPPYSPDMAPQ
jgi:hypothetical protein